MNTLPPPLAQDTNAWRARYLAFLTRLDEWVGQELDDDARARLLGELGAEGWWRIGWLPFQPRELRREEAIELIAGAIGRGTHAEDMAITVTRALADAGVVLVRARDQ